MADKSKIEWADATWTPIKGCTHASEGCRNCYAEIMAARFSKPGQWGSGLAKIVTTPKGKDHRWTGVMRFEGDELLKPLRWKRPRKVFVCSTSDLFHERVPDEWIDCVFAVMALCPHHQFQVLTKRAGRMRKYMELAVSRIADRVIALRRTDIAIRNEIGPGAALWPLPNVWIGVSVEDQASADERIPHLLAVPAAVRFLSCEPLLGPVDLRKIELRSDGQLPNELSRKLGDYVQPLRGNFIGSPKTDWVIVGAESGPGARQMANEWAQSIVDQCRVAGVPVFVKQLSSGGPKAIKNMADFPTGLRVREFPKVGTHG